MPRPRCRHAGVHPSTTDSPAFLPPFLAGWPSTSMPACQHASMPRPRCWHAGVHPSSTDRPAFLAPLPRWLAINQHASMPACHSWGCRRACMLGCMPASACRLFGGAPADAGLVAIALQDSRLFQNVSHDSFIITVKNCSQSVSFSTICMAS